MKLSRGRTAQPEIKGYTREYLEPAARAASKSKRTWKSTAWAARCRPRSRRTETREAKSRTDGTKRCANGTAKLRQAFGNQAQRVVQEAQARGAQEHHSTQERETRAREAVTYARDRNIEREAVVDERQLIRDALRRSMGESTFREVRENLEQRIRSGEFIEVGRERTCRCRPNPHHPRNA